MATKTTATSPKRPARKSTSARRKPTRAAAKKTAKKVPAKKVAARKIAAKRASTKKVAARKTAPQKSAARGTTASRRPRKATVRDLQAVRPVGFTTLADRAFWSQRCRTTVAGNVTVHCGDLSEAILEFVTGAESIVGCVAWLTSKPVLAALAEVPEVGLLVQKERNLREGRDAWSVELRRRYATLGRGPRRVVFPGPLAETDGPERIEPIRCVGYLNSGASGNAPRLHSKFVVAGRTVGDRWVPERVWTGSFNFSANAGSSAENAVVIADAQVASAYVEEFSRMAAISEPLAWTSRMASPALRRRQAA